MNYAHVLGCLLVLSMTVKGSIASDRSQAALLFLTFEPDARSYAMGGTGVAISGGPEASFYNPGAMGNVNSFSVIASFQGVGYFSGHSFMYLSAGYRLENYGTAALAFTRSSPGQYGWIDGVGQSHHFSPYDLAISG